MEMDFAKEMEINYSYNNNTTTTRIIKKMKFEKLMSIGLANYKFFYIFYWLVAINIKIISNILNKIK